jgi:hypothetical protein
MSGWEDQATLREFATSEERAFYRLGVWIRSHWRLATFGLGLLLMWMFWQVLSFWAVAVMVLWLSAAIVSRASTLSDLRALWRRLRHKRDPANPADSPIFAAPAADADEEGLRRELVFIAGLREPTADQRLTFANAWGLLLDRRADNPVRRMLLLATAAMPANAEPVVAVRPLLGAVVGGGSIYRVAAAGLGVTTLIFGAAWGWSEMVEQPRLERRAAQAGQLGVALDEAAAANAALSQALDAERRQRAAERAAHVAYELAVQEEMANTRRRLEAERAGRIAAQQQARRAINEAIGTDTVRRSDDEWLRDIFPSRAAPAGGLPGVPAPAPTGGDP